MLPHPEGPVKWQTAIVHDRSAFNAQSVYVASGDVARSVTITTGSGRGGRVVVTSGLSVGDELIVSGNRSLYDGVPVSKNLDFGEDQPL